MHSRINNRKIELSEFPKLLNTELTYSILNVMLDTPEQYKLPLATIFSQIPLTDIPEYIREKLQPVISDLEMAIKQEHDHWSLCDEAEGRLNRSMLDGATMVINGNLLLKFNGKLSALCLQNMTTKNGALVAGMWYSPIDQETRDVLEERFDDGGSSHVSLSTFPESTWAVMKPLNGLKQISRKEDSSRGQIIEHPAAEYLEAVRNYVKTMPEMLPDTLPGYKGEKITRETYRKLHKAKHSE